MDFHNNSQLENCLHEPQQLRPHFSNVAQLQAHHVCVRNEPLAININYLSNDYDSPYWLLAHSVAAFYRLLLELRE